MTLQITNQWFDRTGRRSTVISWNPAPSRHLVTSCGFHLAGTPRTCHRAGFLVRLTTANAKFQRLGFRLTNLLASSHVLMVRFLPTSAPNPSNATRIGIFFKDLGNEQTPGPRFSKDIIRTVLINFDITFEDIFLTPKLRFVSQTFPTKSTMELMGWNNTT